MNFRVPKPVVLAICIVAASSGVFIALGYAGFFNTSQFTGTTVFFTIVQASSGPLEGMNGSAYYPVSTPWPVLVVNQGERVMIHIINNSTSENHGFAIAHYFNSGVSVHPQGSYNLEFIANEAGNFTIYCDIVCSIHPLMQNGRLVVR